jgi:acetamidase/formamidase
MHRCLIRKTNLTEAQASMLLSLVGNLRISQVVNPFAFWYPVSTGYLNWCYQNVIS